MNVPFYTLKESDFEEVEAEQLQEGDVLALSSPEFSISSQQYGAVQIDQLMHIGTDVVISYRLPTGAHLQSSSKVSIAVDWEEDTTPLITVSQHIEKKQKVLRKRV